MATTRITFNPQIMGGQACIRGMRIPVATVIKLVANDLTPQEIIRHYPDLEPEDIREALRYLASLAEERLVGSH